MSSVTFMFVFTGFNMFKQKTVQFFFRVCHFLLSVLNLRHKRHVKKVTCPHQELLLACSFSKSQSNEDTQERNCSSFVFPAEANFFHSSPLVCVILISCTHNFLCDWQTEPFFCIATSVCVAESWENGVGGG